MRLRFTTRFLFARTLLFFFAFGQLLLGLCAFLLGFFFCCLLKRLLSLADFLQPAITPLQLIGKFVATPVLAVLRILFGIGLFRGGHQGFYLPIKSRLGLVHALVAHCLVLACIGLDLGAVDGHVAKLHQTGFRAQQQRLLKQPSQRIQMPLAKLPQRRVIGS